MSIQHKTVVLLGLVMLLLMGCGGAAEVEPAAVVESATTASAADPVLVAGVCSARADAQLSGAGRSCDADGRRGVSQSVLFAGTGGAAECIC